MYRSIFGLLLVLSTSSYAQGTVDPKELQLMLTEFETKNTGMQTPSTNTVVAPVVAPVEVKKPVKVKTVEAEDKAPAYHYSYTPTEEQEEKYNYQKTLAGTPGNFIMSFMGEIVNHHGSDRGMPGFEGQLGGQANFLNDYLSLSGLVGSGYRKGAVQGRNLIPLSFRINAKVRILSWLYPYAEGGVQFTKVINGIWQKTAAIMGTGVMLRLGAGDRRSEHNLYKAIGVKRTLVIAGFDYIDAQAGSPYFIDSYIVRLGLSFEF